jgi:hypothetical protein
MVPGGEECAFAYILRGGSRIICFISFTLMFSFSILFLLPYFDWLCLGFA